MTTSFKFLKIIGSNAATFLQGQLTCNVKDATETHPILGAHCNIKGRVLFNFLLLYDKNNYYLKLPAEIISLAKIRLEKFAIFSQVTIEESDPLPNTESFGFLLPHTEEVKQGLTTIYPETSGLFTPHELNYPTLGLINFKKGCYTGQEIVARMEYLGNLKKTLCYEEIHSHHEPVRGGMLDQNQMTDYAKIEKNHYAVLLLKKT